jgi:hypothetical protein
LARDDAELVEGRANGKRRGHPQLGARLIRDCRFPAERIVSTWRPCREVYGHEDELAD